MDEYIENSNEEDKNEVLSRETGSEVNLCLDLVMV